jgi:rubrerythrin
MTIANDRLHDLLCQAVETERGGIQVYEAAIRCAVHEELRDEWQAYLEQTREHERVLLDTMRKTGFDAEAQTPGRAPVRLIGEALVAAIEQAATSAPPDAAEVVAAECVVHAETKDHMNWELIGQVGRSLDGPVGEALRAAYERIEDDEDRHLYHTRGWARELALQGLGLPAVVPPPEETMNVTTMIGAARAEASRETMLDPRINAR